MYSVFLTRRPTKYKIQVIEDEDAKRMAEQQSHTAGQDNRLMGGLGFFRDHLLSSRDLYFRTLHTINWTSSD